MLDGYRGLTNIIKQLNSRESSSLSNLGDKKLTKKEIENAA